MSLYWLGRLGLAAQASAALAKQGGPVGIATCPSTCDLITVGGGKEYPWIISGYPWISYHGYPWISMDIQG
jgi:hypothetical protein